MCRWPEFATTPPTCQAHEPVIYRKGAADLL